MFHEPPTLLFVRVAPHPLVGGWCVAALSWLLKVRQHCQAPPQESPEVLVMHRNSQAPFQTHRIRPSKQVVWKATGLTSSQGDAYPGHLVNNGVDEDKEPLKSS